MIFSVTAKNLPLRTLWRWFGYFWSCFGYRLALVWLPLLLFALFWLPFGVVFSVDGHLAVPCRSDTQSHLRWVRKRTYWVFLKITG